MECQCGNWLNAMGGRPKSPSTRETNPITSSSNSLGDNLKNALSMQQEVGKQMMAVAQQGENPAITGYSKFGKSVNFGTLPNLQLFDTIDDRINDTNKESDGAKLTITDKVDFISKTEVIAAQLMAEGGQAEVRSGPN